MPGAGSWNATLAAAMAALNSSVIDSKAYVLRSTRLVPATSVGVALPAAIGAEGGLATGYALAFALVVLAFIEHGFLVVPWQDTRLFRWAMRNRAAPVVTNQMDGSLGADPMTQRRPNSLASLETARH